MEKYNSGMPYGDGENSGEQSDPLAWPATNTPNGGYDGYDETADESIANPDDVLLLKLDAEELLTHGVSYVMHESAHQAKDGHVILMSATTTVGKDEYIRAGIRFFDRSYEGEYRDTTGQIGELWFPVERKFELKMNHGDAQAAYDMCAEILSDARAGLEPTGTHEEPLTSLEMTLFANLMRVCEARLAAATNAVRTTVTINSGWDIFGAINEMARERSKGALYQTAFEQPLDDQLSLEIIRTDTDMPGARISPLDQRLRVSVFASDMIKRGTNFCVDHQGQEKTTDTWHTNPYNTAGPEEDGPAYVRQEDVSRLLDATSFLISKYADKEHDYEYRLKQLIEDCEEECRREDWSDPERYLRSAWTAQRLHELFSAHHDPRTSRPDFGNTKLRDFNRIPTAPEEYGYTDDQMHLELGSTEVSVWVDDQLRSISTKHGDSLAFHSIQTGIYLVTDADGAQTIHRGPIVCGTMYLKGGTNQAIPLGESDVQFPLRDARVLYSYFPNQAN